jgi:c-di-GMP-binding flagellar brake protein YcgR
MDQNNGLSGEELEDRLAMAKDEGAYASLRAIGSPRMLGDLQVRGLEPGIAIQLMGVKRREQFPPAGTEVILSILLGDEVISSRTTLLDPIVFAEGDTMFPPVLRVGWPTEAIQTHRRHDVRVATPDLPPLEAILEFDGQRLEAHLLNLTETGMGLGLSERLSIPLKTQVEVETRIPGGELIRTSGEVRHAELVEHEPLPMRLGVVLGHLTEAVQDALHRFIQARRMDRSEELRRSR